jgi:hypothetical protein
VTRPEWRPSDSESDWQLVPLAVLPAGGHRRRLGRPRPGTQSLALRAELDPEGFTGSESETRRLPGQSHHASNTQVTVAQPEARPSSATGTPGAAGAGPLSEPGPAESEPGPASGLRWPFKLLVLEI